MNFDQAFTRLLGHEGSYSNDPRDNGGETMWGITVKVARANGYFEDMEAMPQSVAKGIYKRMYWDAIKADQLPASCRYDVFDAAVNSGVTQAIKWLQRSVSVPDDGILGPFTLQAVSVVGNDIKARFNAHRLEFMASLPTWPAFGRGWARRIASNLKG